MDDSPFVSLPPEIRNYIWELAVTSPSKISQLSRSKVETALGRLAKRALNHSLGPQIFKTQSVKQPLLTFVSRQVRDESIGLYYSSNVFTHMPPVPRYSPGFEQGSGLSLSYLIAWLNKIGLKNAQALRKIKVLLPGSWCTWPGDPWKLKESRYGWTKFFNALKACGCATHRLEVEIELMHECLSPHKEERKQHVVSRKEKQRVASEYVQGIKDSCFGVGKAGKAGKYGKAEVAEKVV